MTGRDGVSHEKSRDACVVRSMPALSAGAIEAVLCGQRCNQVVGHAGFALEPAGVHDAAARVAGNGMNLFFQQDFPFIFDEYRAASRARSAETPTHRSRQVDKTIASATRA